MKMKIVLFYLRTFEINLPNITYFFSTQSEITNFTVNKTNALLAMTKKNLDKKFEMEMQTEQNCFAAADKMCMVFCFA